MSAILFVLGFIFLFKGAEYLIEGAASMAQILGVSNIVIGLTVVALGTSLPELFVNIFAAADGHGDLIIGNILGSNITNILLILGIGGLIYPLVIRHGTVWKEIPFSLLAVLVLGFLANDALVDGRGYSELSRIDGAVLLSFFVIFIYYIFAVNRVEPIYKDQIPRFNMGVSILLVILGVTGLSFGGRFIVDGAIEIARFLSISEALIGLSVVALGTSLPELAAVVVATMKKNPDVAIGGIVGSNIFNVFWILGLSSVIGVIPYNPVLNLDLLVVVFATILLFLVTTSWKENQYRISRIEGVVFLLTYVVYVSYLFWRG